MSFQELPAELLANIFSDTSLSKNDLMSLRLSSKQILPLASRTLAKRYLSHVSILLTADGLQKLNDLCAHPEFGPYILSVRVPSDRISREQIGSLLDKIGANAKPRGLAREVQLYVDRYLEEQKMDARRADCLLTTALASLQKHGNSISLICDNTPVERANPSCRLNKSHLEIESSKMATLAGDDIQLGQTSNMLLQAACHAGLSVHGLRLAELKDYDDAPMKLSIRDPNIVQAMARGLKRICFKFELCFIPDSVRLLCQILSHAKDLRHLHLTLDIDSDGESTPGGLQPCNEIMEASASNAHEFLSLSYIHTSKRYLLELLEKSHGTIKVLKLKRVAVEEWGWPEILRYIKTLPKLRRLVLVAISTYEGINLCDYWWDDIDVTGRKRIHKRIDKEIKEALG